MIESDVKKIAELTEEIQRIKSSVKDRKFGLVFEDRPEVLPNKIHILESVSDRLIKAPEDPWFEDTCRPAHMLVEGDNFDALMCLNYTHKGKVDVIYIDPPYNTGSDGFRYKDTRESEEFPDGVLVPKGHPYRDSAWLSFMSKRLKLARTLMSDTGVIIIHIDEFEEANLTLLLKDIFGPDNFIGKITWDKGTAKGNVLGIAMTHEYVLICAKNKEELYKLDNVCTTDKKNAKKILNKADRVYSKLSTMAIPEDVREVLKPFKYGKNKLAEFEVPYTLELINKEFGYWLSKQSFSVGEKSFKHIDEQGRVYNKDNLTAPYSGDPKNRNIKPLIHPNGKECPLPTESRTWCGNAETMQQLSDDGLICFGDDETTIPSKKVFLKDVMRENTSSVYKNSNDDIELFKMLDINFKYAKPVSGAKYWITAIHPNAKVILDFFAGSGTTGHAVMELNAEDGGKRQVILVTNNENNIMTDVCWPRLDKVANGYKTFEALGGRFNYYRTALVGSHNSATADDADVLALARGASELLAVRENTLYHVSQNDYWQVFENEDIMMAVYFREETDRYEEFISLISSFTKPVIVYVFDWDETANRQSDFDDDVVVKIMPHSILATYSHLTRLISSNKI